MKQLILFAFFVLFAFGDNATSSAGAGDELNANLQRLQKIDALIDKNGFWVKRYYDHQEYNAIRQKIADTSRRLRDLGKLPQTRPVKMEMASLNAELATARSKLSLLGEIGQNPYESLTRVDEISPAPEITNPFSIFTALSYLSDLNAKKKTYEKQLASLQETLEHLKEKDELLAQMLSLAPFGDDDPAPLKKRAQDVRAILAELRHVQEIFTTTLAVHNKKTQEIESALKVKIAAEGIKGVKILVFLVFLFIASLFVKMLVKKTVEDSNRVFNIYRVINITGFLIAAFVLTFNYINNLTYFITVLGFVSAGIAIAMKDWFMNMLGWFVIVLGGSIHVGDRIKITKDNFEYVGDVLEISLTRVTLFEDVTLTSYTTNRRTGRVIMFPNNYIFSSIILNYTFSGLKTVWDGVDIMITFTSNHKKAVHIARDIVKKYSKGYTDITRKQMNDLRGAYHIRNFNPEPRVYTFIENYGIKISAWYLTNSYATLTLRSNISAEIVEAYNAAPDIKIAYPSQTVMLSSRPASRHAGF